MWEYIYSIGVIIFFIVIVYKLKSEPLISKLAEKYGVASRKVNWSTANSSFHYWLNSDDKNTKYINGVILDLSDRGLLIEHIAPNHFFYKPMFIKWDQMVFKGVRRILFRDKIVFLIRDTNIYFCISRKHFSELKMVYPSLISDEVFNKDRHC